jgi:hypothetical protein
MKNIARLERCIVGRITGGINGRGAGIGDYKFATALKESQYGEVEETEVIEQMTLRL